MPNIYALWTLPSHEIATAEHIARMAGHLDEVLQVACYRHVPSTEIDARHKNWWSPHLTLLKKELKYLSRRKERWNKRHPNTPLPPGWFEDWKIKKTEFKTAIRQAKEDHGNSIMEVVSSDGPNSAWRLLPASKLNYVFSSEDILYSICDC